MECLPMTLAQYLDQYGVPPDEIGYSILKDVALALSYLHQHDPPIIHRDLSANNVLLTRGMTAKISDLGVAKILDLDPKVMQAMTKGPGTPCYMPPEALEEEAHYDCKLDAFSYGVLMVHLFSGRWPLPTKAVIIDPQDPTRVIPQTEADRRQKNLNAIRRNHPLMNLILHCIHNNPDLRPEAVVILGTVSQLAAQFPDNKGELLQVTSLRADIQQEHALVIRSLRAQLQEAQLPNPRKSHHAQAHVERERADIKILNSDLEMYLQAWKEHAQHRPLRLLVCGCRGAGKSALVNHLLQLKEAKEGFGGAITTSVVSKYEGTTERGIKVCIFDTPGFGDVLSDEKIIAMMLKETESQTKGKLDLVLFCLSLGNPAARVQQADVDAIRKVTQAFTCEIWKKAVIVLTYANQLAEFKHIKKAEDYNTVVDNIKTRLRDVLHKNKVSEEVISQLPIVTAGHTNPILKYEEDKSPQAWDDRLFLEALKQVDLSQCPSLFQCRWGWKDVIVAGLVGGAGGSVLGAAGVGVGAAIGAAGGPAGLAVGAGIGGAIGGGVTGAAVGGTTGASGGVLLLKRREITTILKIMYEKWQMEKK